MNCKYCSASNMADDHRCGRCGRKLLVTVPSLSSPQSHRPFALAYQREVELESSSVAVEAPPERKPAPPRHQPALFTSPEQSRVVPIFGPQIVSKPVAPPKQPSRRRTDSPEIVRSTQQQLSFGHAQARRPMEVESEIYCSAPVASTQHRVVSAFIDCGVIAIATTMIAAIFFIWTGASIELDPVSLSIAGGMVAMVAIFYQILWVLGNGETSGMRMTQLTLVNFDGRRPGRRQRFARTTSAWLSFAPGALGLFWALVDEEHLTWHDQISKTFPTPRH